MRAGRAIASGIVLATLVAAAGAVAVSRVDPGAVRDFLTDAARQATGREVVVRGATELNLFPSPTLVAENVIIGNAPWSVSPDMARVKRLEARVRILPLFLGQLHVSRFRLREPHLLLETDHKGRRNWNFEAADGDSGERAFLSQMQSRIRMVVSEVQIVDGTVSLRRGKRTRTIRIPDLSAYGDLARGSLAVAGRGAFAGRDWKLSGNVGELSTLLGNEPYHLDFVLSTRGTRLSGEGAIERPLDGTGLAMNVKLSARRASDLLALAGSDLELPGSVHGSAVLGDVDGIPRLDSIKAEVHIEGGHVTATGSVENLASLRGLDLRVNVEAKTLAGLGRVVGVELPKAARLVATAKVRDSKDRLRMEELSGQLRLRGATVALSGRIKDLVAVGGVDLGLALETPSLAHLSRYLGVQLPPVGPVKASARLSRTRHGYKLAKLDARIARSEASGELFLYPHRKRPRVVGSLKSKRFDLDPFLPAQAQTGSTRIFTSTPFSVEWLRSFDGDVSVHATTLQVRGVQVSQARVGMSLKDGQLLFTPTGKLAGGSFKAKLSLDARNVRPRLAVRIRGKGIALGKVASQYYKTEVVEGARSDVNIDVAGRGQSMSELMAGLSGGIYVAAGKATVHNQRLENLSGDVVTTILSTVAMQSADEKTTHVRCGVVRVLVRDGIVDVDRTIAMETSRAAMSTSGTISLRDEGLDLGVSLVGRNGPSLGAGTFSGLVRVRGTMAEPKIVANPAGIAGAAATVAGAVVTSGLSLIAQGLISQISADRSTCRTALEIAHDGDSHDAAFSHAGSRDSEDFDSATGPRERRRRAAQERSQPAPGKRPGDGN